MIVRDTIRVKTDGKGSIRLVIMRDGNAIAAILNYSFADDKEPLVIAEEVQTQGVCNDEPQSSDNTEEAPSSEEAK